MSFAGKHVVVTGGTGGLGPAVVDALLDAGADVHLPVRRAEGGARARVHVTSGVDLTDEAAVARFYAACPTLWASIHVAGGFTMGAFRETSLTTLRQQLDINLVTAFLASREALKKMNGGRIVNVTARAALVPSGGAIAYSIAKAGIAHMTAALADEVKGSGVLVNAVAPQIIDTPTNRAAMPKADFSTWAKPADIARTILFLASAENVLTTGAVVPVYGG
jgi:NAD(P)-dependent dehydrogenase (short-subunit alcohol dehydrogenase family)